MATKESGRFAVVTGAASGIGFDLSRILAQEGFDLLITGEKGELRLALEELKETSTKIEAHRVDLAAEWGVIKLYRHIQNTGRPVDVLALNAGADAGGAFATETKLSEELKLIDVNVRSSVHLCKLVVGDMVKRDAGLILISSVSQALPEPFQAVYDAARSFVQSFALALADELKDTGIVVTALMPGATETEIFERTEDVEVAHQGLAALVDGKEKVVSGT